MNYHLVSMDRSHLEQVAALERACFPDPWSEKLLEQELYNDMSSLVVAQGEDGTVLAARDSRWTELEDRPVEGAPPETLYLDFVTARGTEFTVEVPLGTGGEGQ